MKKKIILWLAKATWLFRLVEWSSQLKKPRIFVHFAIWFYFIKIVKANLKEASRENIQEYHSVIDFFTRKLKKNIRPITQIKNEIASPVDALIISAGKFKKKDTYLIKNKAYHLNHLLPNNPNFISNKIIEKLSSGTYISQYLSPKDYHRISWTSFPLGC